MPMVKRSRSIPQEEQNRQWTTIWFIAVPAYPWGDTFQDPHCMPKSVDSKFWNLIWCFSCTCIKVLIAQSCPTLWDPMQCSPRLLCPWNSPGKNTGAGSHYLLQGIFPTQGWNSGIMYCRQILYYLSHQRSPIPVIKFNLQIRHNERLTTITTNKIQLHNNILQ